MADATNFSEERLHEILLEMHHAQKCSFFLEDVMGKVMDALAISDGEAIEIARFLIRNDFVAAKSFLPAVFLRPGHIRMFPVVLTTKAISLISKKQEQQA